MPARNDPHKRGLVILVLTTVIAVAVAAWNLCGERAARPATAADAGSARAVPAAVASKVAPQLSGIAPKASTAAQQTQRPLPSPGTPLATIYEELRQRADAGDAGAATRLYHEVHRCVAVRQKRRLMAEFHPMIADNPDVSSIGLVHDGQPPQIMMLREMTDYIEANNARCEGATDTQLASLTPLTLHAAQLGDLKAVDCYVGTDFDMIEGLLDHPEWIDQYRAQVPGLVESALQRGDWVVVDLLHHAYS